MLNLLGEIGRTRTENERLIHEKSKRIAEYEQENQKLRSLLKTKEEIIRCLESRTQNSHSAPQTPFPIQPQVEDGTTTSRTSNEQQVKKLKDQLEQSREEIRQLKETNIAQYKAQEVKVEALVASKEQQVKELKDQLERSQEENQHLKQTNIAKYKAREEELIMSVTTKEKQIKELRDQLEQSQRDVRHQKLTIISQRAQEEKLKVLVTLKEQQATELQHRLDESQKENQRLKKTTIAQYKGREEELMMSVTSKEQQVKKLQDRLDESQEEIRHLKQTTIPRYKAQEEELMMSVTSIEQQATELKHQLEQSHEEIRHLKETIDRYEKRNFELNAQLRKRDDGLTVDLTKADSSRRPLKCTQCSQSCDASPECSTTASTAIPNTPSSTQTDQLTLISQVKFFVPTPEKITKKRRDLNLSDLNFNIVIVGEIVIKELETSMQELGSMEGRQVAPVFCKSIDIEDHEEVFRQEGLYAFNLVILLTAGRIPDSGITLALQCQRSRIPYIFVRHKMWHVEERAKADVSEQSGDSYGMSLEHLLFLRREEMYKEFDDLMEKVSLPKRDEGGHFFLVDERSLELLVRGFPPRVIFDESKLVEYIMSLRREHARILWENLIGG